VHMHACVGMDIYTHLLFFMETFLEAMIQSGVARGINQGEERSEVNTHCYD